MVEIDGDDKCEMGANEESSHGEKEGSQEGDGTNLV
jgi:hypothetical protein